MNNTFSKMLKDKKLKITPQRIAILEELYKHGHSSVDDIYILIKNRIPSVSLATIYKNITYMHNEGILKSVKTPTQKQKYEINQKPHIHLFCKICDRLDDFDMDTDKLKMFCETKSGYGKIDNISIILTGICPECRAAHKNTI